jgi:site-specific DNA-methyltransferase (adenine-specific)
MNSDWEVVSGYAHEFSSDMLLKEKARLIFTDPPFGTGKMQKRGEAHYDDHLRNDLVLQGIRTSVNKHLDEEGTLAVLCDYRLAYELVPFVKKMGMSLRGEIVWQFGLGRPRSSWWPNRHNHIYTFTWGEDTGLFDASAIPREKRLAPKPGYPDDKPAGSVWDYTMSNTDPERVEYPNQKPIAVIEPFIKAHTNPGDIVLDPFCGSGSTGRAALKHGRRFVGVDSNYQAVKVATSNLIDQ